MTDDRAERTWKRLHRVPPRLDAEPRCHSVDLEHAPASGGGRAGPDSAHNLKHSLSNVPAKPLHKR